MYSGGRPPAGVGPTRAGGRAGPAAGDGMEGCRRLGNGLAGAAREALADGLDHLPADWLDLERFRDVLAQLRQPAAAAGAGGRTGEHDPLARQMGRQGRAYRLVAGWAVGATRTALLVSGLLRLGGVLAGGGHQLTELELQLIDQLAAALGGGAVLVMLEPGDQQLEVRDHRLGAGGACLGLAPRQTLGREFRLQRGDSIGQAVRRGRHAVMGSHLLHAG